MAYSCKAKAAGTDADFDLACAIVSAAKITSTVEGTEDRNFALQTHSFYLGRLSGRDGKTRWFDVITGRIAELRERSHSKEIYGDCLAFLAKQLER